MVKREVTETLRNIVGLQRVLDEEEELEAYAYDATPGLPLCRPDVVVKVELPDQVPELLAVAQRYEMPVVPRGAGTNLSGGTVPVHGGMVLALAGLGRVIEIDEANLTATVEPGVVTADLHRAVERRGLFYPPDPGSMSVSTMGGNVAECSGGLRGLKYGVTKDYVMGLKAAFMTGEVIRTGGKTVKNVTGYDLTRLLTGSEGTLAVITEITVKLLPLPEARRALLAVFADLDSAARTVSRIIAEKIIPSTLEIMDNVTIRAVEAFSHVGLPESAGAVLLIEVDGPAEVATADARAVERVCRAEGASDVRVAAAAGEMERVWAARRVALSALARVRPTAILEDATVPRSQVPAMAAAITEIARRWEIQVGLFGHAGDGNLHPTLLADRRDKEEMRRASLAAGEIFEMALNLGGTLSGEHGIGLSKSAFMPKEVGRAGLDVMRRLKASVDPKGLLNPGKIFPLARAGGGPGVDAASGVTAPGGADAGTEAS